MARAAQLYGIELHAYCFLSNHYHLVLTDPHARLPDFMRYLNEHTARAINASLGRWEGLWASGTYSAVRLETPEDIVAKIAYTLANPTAAGLVERAEHWPGLWSHPREFGRAAVVALRPQGGYFRAAGPTPGECGLRLMIPQVFEDRDSYVALVSDALRANEDAAIAAMRAKGTRFLGRRGILAQRVEDSPATLEVRRELNPRVAGWDRWRRIEALCRLRAFVEAYRAAREALRAGIEGVLFPAGTYCFRVQHGQPCAPS